MHKFAIIIILLISKNIFAETILLKNRKIIKGKVVGQNASSLQVNVNGNLQNIPKRTILKVVYKDVNAAEAEKIRKEEEAKLKAKAAADKKKAEELEQARLAEEEKKKEEQLAAEKKEKDEKKKQSEQAHALKKKKVSPWVKSALLPGLGQMTSGHAVSGAMWTTLFIGSVANVVAKNSAMKREKLAYEQAFESNSMMTAALTDSTVFPGYFDIYFLQARTSLYSNYQNSAKELNTAISIMGLVYALQITHAVFMGKNQPVKDNSSVLNNLDFAISREQFATRMENKGYLQYSWYF